MVIGLEKTPSPQTLSPRGEGVTGALLLRERRIQAFSLSSGERDRVRGT
jgi:hypothetical protein